MSKYDVIVVGAGNAAMAAALTAADEGCRVVVLDAAGPDDMGGNTRYAAGQMRTVFHGAEDLAELVPDLSAEEIAQCEFGAYTRDNFLDHLMTLSGYRCNPDLMELVVDGSFETLKWMRSVGVKFQISYGNQARKVGGKFVFWGGLPCEVWGGGPGLLEAYYAAAKSRGIDIRNGTYVRDLHYLEGRLRGVEAVADGNPEVIEAGSVVLACGGFEASAEMRARYLGPNWDLAKVRGTRFNTGAGLNMAMARGAQSAGNWSGAHSTCWDVYAPDFGNLAVGDGYQKFSYPLGIMVNQKGERFIDEGSDFQTFTYARIGRHIIEQPGMRAWQVFDSRAIPHLRDEYRIKEITKATGDTIEELGKNMEGVDSAGFARTVREYNAAVPDDTSLPDLTRKDGRATKGLSIPKSNWACRIDKPPFAAFGITTGITFTFGGLAVSTSAEVLDVAGTPMKGLYAAGEIVGGIFYGGYPGGTGLVSGAVMGRIAGRRAAAAARLSHS
ncbi:MAG: FAD-dependent tricarballylate dehydrogenase TcuA [Hyphomicrobiales bacterium]